MSSLRILNSVLSPNSVIKKLVSVFISMESRSVKDECGLDDIYDQHQSFDQVGVGI